MSWNEISTFLISQVKTNQFLTGATITGAIAGVVYFLRDKLYRLWTTSWRFFAVSLAIHSEDPLYIPVSTWLYKHNFDRFSRSYRVRYVDGKATYGPAEGSFLFFYKRQMLRISVVRDSGGNQNSSWRSQTRETLTISYYSFKRSRAVLNAIIDDAVKAYNSASEGVPVYAGNCLVTRIPRRSVPSVILAGDTLAHIEQDITSFLSRRDWYLDRGVPYHRGYLFTGPPGTGKTSLVRHLAQKFDLPVYVSDGTMRSISSAPPNSILLLEDVDSIAKMRDSVKMFSGAVPQTNSTSSPDGSKSPSHEDLFAPTLSELLNALDGVASTDGIIVAMTTNHPEHIDPAILRPGRVDYKLHLDRCTVEQATRMFVKFYGPDYAEAFSGMIGHHQFTPAQLQETFIACAEPEMVLDWLQEEMREAA